MADRITVGNVEIVAVLDMIPPPREPSDFFPDVSADQWEPYREEVLDGGKVQLYYGCFVLRSLSKTILVDTGMGPGPHPTRGNRTGDLLNQLNKQGVSPEEVDVVVHTHLHADHVGWNLRLSEDVYHPNFPGASYLVPRLDWDHFTGPEIIGSAPQVTHNVVPLETLGLMELIESDHKITDEVTTLATPGHTPGHQAVLVNSAGERAMVVGDVLHSKVQVQEPGWCAGVDIDKRQSQDNRETLLDRAETENYVIAAGHFHPSEHIGRIVRLKGRRYWQALP